MDIAALLDAIKSGKILNYYEYNNYTDPYNGDNVQVADVDMRYAPENDRVEIRTENTASQSHPEVIFEKIPFTEFETYLISLKSRGGRFSILEKAWRS